MHSNNTEAPLSKPGRLNFRQTSSTAPRLCELWILVEILKRVHFESRSFILKRRNVERKNIVYLYFIIWRSHFSVCALHEHRPYKDRAPEIKPERRRALLVPVSRVALREISSASVLDLSGGVMKNPITLCICHTGARGYHRQPPPLCPDTIIALASVPRASPSAPAASVPPSTLLLHPATSSTSGSFITLAMPSSVAPVEVILAGSSLRAGGRPQGQSLPRLRARRLWTHGNTKGRGGNKRGRGETMLSLPFHYLFSFCFVFSPTVPLKALWEWTTEAGRSANKAGSVLFFFSLPPRSKIFNFFHNEGKKIEKSLPITLPDRSHRR